MRVCKIENLYSATVTDLARVMGVTQSTASKRFKNFYATGEGGAKKLDIPATLAAWYTAVVLPQSGVATSDPRRRLDEAKAESAELDLAIKKSQYISLADAVKTVAEMVAELQAGLLRIEMSLPQKLHHQPPNSISKILKKSHDDLLDELDKIAQDGGIDTDDRD